MTNWLEKVYQTLDREPDREITLIVTLADACTLAAFYISSTFLAWPFHGV